MNNARGTETFVGTLLMLEPDGTKNAAMATNNDEQMREELHDLFVTARTCELTTAAFAARLESVHARFLGSAAQASDLLKRRSSATTVYDDLLAGAGMDRHHHLELLAEALNLSPHSCAGPATDPNGSPNAWATTTAAP